MIFWRDRNIARNPIARALIKQEMKKAMLDMRIYILMLEDGESAHDAIMTIADSMHVVARCYEIMEKQDSVEFRMLRSALSILRECSENKFIWKRSYAITLDNAINICSQNWTKIPSKIFQEGMRVLD